MATVRLYGKFKKGVLSQEIRKKVNVRIRECDVVISILTNSLRSFNNIHTYLPEQHTLVTVTELSLKKTIQRREDYLKVIRERNAFLLFKKNLPI